MAGGSRLDTGPCSAVSLAHPLQAPQLFDGGQQSPQPDTGLPRSQRRKEHKCGAALEVVSVLAEKGCLGGCGQGGTGDPKPRELQPRPYRESIPMSSRMGGDHCVYSSYKCSLLPWGPAGTCI